MSSSPFSYVEHFPVLAKLDDLPTREVRIHLHNSGGPRSVRFTYKYRSCDPTNLQEKDRVEDILVRANLWISNSKEFNDPFDLASHISFEGSNEVKHQAILEKIARQYPYMSAWQRRQLAIEVLAKPDSEVIKHIRQAFENSKRTLGICSFADDPRSILMWSHYAKNHTGLAIQFEIAQAPSVFFPAEPVVYSEEHPVINWAGDTVPALGKVVLSKADAWKYELERRLVLPDRAGTTLPFPAKACVGVILGCRASGQTLEFVRACNAQRQSLSLPVFKIFRAHQSPRSINFVEFLRDSIERMRQKLTTLLLRGDQAPTEYKIQIRRQRD